MGTPWLERLEHATTYRELQEVFAQIAAAAEGADDPGAVASAIRDAVVRVERERERDEQELDAFEKDYAAFRSDQRGVMGWLKRHLPFSETRRKEKEHKGALADQKAEILGDSLVIARAEMLCEHLVPTEERATGLKASEWSAVLAADASRERIGAYAESVTYLAGQLERGRSIVDGVNKDIEAFDDARFTSDGDESRRKADVKAARKEVAVFADRLQAVETVRSEAYDHMRAVVTADLMDADPAFAQLSAQLPRLQTAASAAAAALDVLEELQESVSGLGELEERLLSEPQQRVELKDRVRRLRGETEEAARHAANAEAELSAPAARYEQAQRAEQLARSDVRAAQDALSNYLETTGQFELEPGQSVDDATPADAALTRAQATLQSAHAELRAAEPPYEQARAIAEQARKQRTDFEQRLAQVHKELSAIDERFATLRAEFDRRRDEVRPVLDRLPELARAYRDAMHDAGRDSALPGNHEGLRPPRRFEVPGFSFGDGDSDIERAAEHWQTLSEALESEQAALARDVAELQEQRDTLWQRHATRLLGADLAGRL